MKKIAAFIALFFISLHSIAAHASEELGWAVMTGFESWHSDSRDDLNPHNTGIGVRMPSGWTLGTYYNSIRTWSVYAGYEWQWRLFGDENRALRIGAVGGVVTGYKGGVKALLLPELVMWWKPIEVGIMVIPRYTKDPVTVALQLRYAF